MLKIFEISSILRNIISKVYKMNTYKMKFLKI